MSTLIGTLKRSALASPLLVAHRRFRSSRSIKDIAEIRAGRPVGDGEIVCVSVMRNEMLRLPDFFRHYRALGLEKFIVIDNGSTDGTREFLLDQPDVDLYSCLAPYPDSHFGIYWSTGLLRRLGIRGWVLQVDADEHLVYDGCERLGLDDLVRLLEDSGRRSLPTMMLDMYPLGPISDAAPGPDDRLVDICPLFDADGYRLLEKSRRWEVPRLRHYAGGPRERLFSDSRRTFHCELAKTPLVRWDPGVTYIHSHSVYPFDLNFGAPTGGLLHFKLMKDFHDRARDAVSQLNHYAGSIEYRQYMARLDQEPGLSAAFEGSRRYQDSRSLIDAGLMTPIDWR